MANGGIIYVDQETRQLSVTNGSGTLRRHLGSPALLNSRPAWSPDGSRVAVDKRTFDAGGRLIRELPFSAWDPSWSPDGTQIAFRSGVSETDTLDPDQSRSFGPLAIAPADGSGRPVPLGQGEFNGYPAWSPDSTSVAFSQVTQGATAAQIVRHHLATGHQDVIFGPVPGFTQLTMAAWAPGGYRLAFAMFGNEVGGTRGRIALVNGDGTGFHMLVSSPHVLTFPTWSPDGDFIAYTQIHSQTDEGKPFSDSAIMVVPAAGGTPLQVAAGAGPSWTTPRATAISVVGPASTVTVGQAMTTNAVVRSADGLVPGQGPVAITLDGVFIDRAQLDPNGDTVIPLPVTSGGSHRLAVIYDGDGELAATTGQATFAVGKATPTLHITTSPNPAPPGASVTVAVTLDGIAGVPATGSVAVVAGLVQVGTLPAGQPGTVVLAQLTAGRGLPIFASYPGDTHYTVGVSAIVAQDVVWPTRTAVTADHPEPVFGQAVTLTADVSGVLGAEAPPTGSVSFAQDAAILATVPLTAGKASLQRPMPVGVHAIVATYSGDRIHAESSSAPAALAVAPAATDLTLTVPVEHRRSGPVRGPMPVTVAPGQAIPLVATVTAAPPSTAVPHGRIRFTDATDRGTRTLGQTVLDPATGPKVIAPVAGVDASRLTVAFTAAETGEHHVAATFLGAAEFLSSTAEVLIVVTA